jgi:glucose-1-phosphate adenylyltransferase
MDFQEVITQHIITGAEITVATMPVGRRECHALGIMQTDDEGRIVRFVEKPKEDAVLDTLKMTPEMQANLNIKGGGETFLASMGIYVFNRKVICELLDNPLSDFGKHIIPHAINSRRVFSYVFQGYWEDIGTIRAFFDANLKLTDPVPEYSFFDSTSPVYTHARFLPASKFAGATIKQAVISDGCKIGEAHIERSVIGIRSYIGSGSSVRNSIVMGADFYDHDMAAKEKAGDVPYGIGKNCVVEHTIVDKNARIGDGSAISPEGKPPCMDGENFFVRDGIVIIPKNAILPPGSWI